MNAWSKKVIERAEVDKARAALELLAKKPPERVVRAQAIRELAKPIRALLDQGYALEEIIKAMSDSDAFAGAPVAAVRQLLRDADAQEGVRLPKARLLKRRAREQSPPGKSARVAGPQGTEISDTAGPVEERKPGTPRAANKIID